MTPRCKHCGKPITKSSQSDRVYAIEEGKIGSLVCKFDYGQTIYHEPETVPYEAYR